jgi:protein TonB
MHRSRSVSIDLVTFQKPAEKPEPPPPKAVQPKPKPKPKPIPKPKPMVPPEPPPAPRPSPPEPPAATATDTAIEVPENLSEPAPAAAEDAPAPGSKEQPAIQVSEPRYDINPAPHYPFVARRRNYQGVVLLDVQVTADGRVSQVRIAQSSGYAILDKSAVTSVKEWLFTPARKRGRPVQMWVQVPIRYQLK